MFVCERRGERVFCSLLLALATTVFIIQILLEKMMSRGHFVSVPALDGLLQFAFLLALSTSVRYWRLLFF